MLVAPDRRMSSRVTTCTAAAAADKGSALRDTDVTSIFRSSSMLSFFRISTESTACAGAYRGNSKHDTIEATCDREKNVRDISDLLLFIREGTLHRSFQQH